MDGKRRGSQRPVCFVGLLLLTAHCCGIGLAAAQDEPVLLGLLARDEVEAAMPDWVLAEVEATPDLDAAGFMATALSGAEVTVYFGTWCSDSGRELSRLWRALDEVGVLNPAEIRYIGVDRQMAEPVGYATGQNLKLVPTFVVSRGGEEVGRIVESSPNGIERDLLALLQGDKTGLITGSEVLETEGDGH